MEAYRRLHRRNNLSRRIAPAPMGEAGFTLMELLVVLGILSLLAAFVAPKVVGYMGQARSDVAKSQISAISTALELYALDNGTYPSQQAGLAGLVQQPQNAPNWHGPYLKKADGLLDPWGHPYGYRVPGQKGEFEIWSLGRDGQPGGTGEDQDIAN
jgi:general secretion pathway protein G